MSTIQQILLSMGSTGAASSIIQSIQQVSITIAAGGTSNTATISSVNTAKTAIFFNGLTGPSTSSNPSTSFAGVSLTDATTVTATRNTADGSNALTVKATVVEFTSAAIQSINAGTITMTGTTSNTATISSVTTGNSVAVYGGFTTTNTAATAGPSSWSAVALTNATTVTASRASSSNNATVYYTIIEFASGILNSSTQQGTITMTSVSSNTATISSVTTGKTMLVHGGHTQTYASAIGSARQSRISLTNATTVTANRGSGDATTTVAYYTVVEFAPALVNSVQRNTITISASSASNTRTITSVNTAKSLANYVGQHNSGEDVIPDKGYAHLTLTNATTLTAARNTATAASSHTLGEEVIEFV